MKGVNTRPLYISIQPTHIRFHNHMSSCCNLSLDLPVDHWTWIFSWRSTVKPKSDRIQRINNNPRADNLHCQGYTSILGIPTSVELRLYFERRAHPSWAYRRICTQCRLLQECKANSHGRGSRVLMPRYMASFRLPFMQVKVD